jgi:hypothetical protein
MFRLINVDKMGSTVPLGLSTLRGKRNGSDIIKDKDVS